MDCKVGLSVLLFCVIGLCAAERYPNKAVCLVSPMSGMAGSQVQGRIVFEQKEDEMLIKISLKGFTGEKGDQHGFHVHTRGNMSSGCMATEGHYNPEGKTHGAPSDQTRHVGDLGNIMEDGNGEINTEIRDPVVRLDGNYSILGRAIVIHAKADDLGKGGDAGSLKTGNAGGRMGCCVITAEIPPSIYPPISAGADRSDVTRSAIMTSIMAYILYMRP